MKFLIVGHVIHKLKNGQIYGYGPYVREMNIWGRNVDELMILAPISSTMAVDPIDLPFENQNIKFFPVRTFNTVSVIGKLNTLFSLPGIFVATWGAMKKADHIHLRCPGNMGLIGSLVQVFFPNKIKTTKYAGNWDKNSQQPLSYRLQQKILSKSEWTKNMQVLVYGEWPNESKNIKPFFTASYLEKEIEEIQPKELKPNSPIRLIFAGGLTPGKQPLISAEVCLKLRQSGLDCRLDIYGDGAEKNKLLKFIADHKLDGKITLYGNQPSSVLKEAYKNSHFLIFISQSEGWPKVVAESMFWACLPITTSVSCVPQMLGYGERGELVDANVEEICRKISGLLERETEYKRKVTAAMTWSREYTIERFEEEIKNLLEKTSLRA